MDNNIFNLLGLFTAMGGNDDFLYLDDKMMRYSVSLVMEIDDLLDKGYKYEDIAKLIENCDFKNLDSDLDEEEIMFLRNHTFRLLDIRYELYLDDKKIKKLEKTCDN